LTSVVAGLFLVGMVGGTGFVALSEPAAAQNSCGAPVSSDGVSTVTCSYSGAVSTFMAPPGVMGVEIVVDGAAGGPSAFGAPGGNGGQEQGGFSLTPGELLTVVVGGQGQTSGTAAFGGGGAGTVEGGGGGGGSFVYGASGKLLVAAGGGGGSAGPCCSDSGGNGGGKDGAPGLSTTAGLGGGGATHTSGGTGGQSGPDGTAGGNGAGPATFTAGAPVVGAGGAAGSPGGGGGGGGYFGGGGGGGGNDFGGGGGGSGYLSPRATSPSSASGVDSGDGLVTFSWSTPAITSGDATTFTVGADELFTVTTTGAPGGGGMSISDGSATLPAGVAFTDNHNGTASLTGTPAAGTAGTYLFTITASNGNEPEAVQTFTLKVNPLSIACGVTIVGTVTLAHDMDCRADTTTPALIVGAAGVTVNLNGHAILGPGALEVTYGVYDLGHTHLRVENGTFKNFLADLVVEGPSSTGNRLNGVVIQDLTTSNTVAEDSYGVYGYDLYGADIDHLTIRNAYTGVELEYNSHSRVWHNLLIAPFYGFVDYAGIDNSWSSNILKDVNYNGIEALGTDEQTIAGNTITGITADGIYSENADSLSVTGNLVSDLLTGIDDEASSNSTFSNNLGLDDGWGIYSFEPSGATFSGNQFDLGKYGIETDYPEVDLFTDNVTNHNTESGIYIWTGDQTGFPATLDSNTANNNRFGFYAQIPTTGSGNIARFNKVINCFHVSCRSPSASALGVRGPIIHQEPRPIATQSMLGPGFRK
jgi:Right handed beta helix region/Putative Ig domain